MNDAARRLQDYRRSKDLTQRQFAEHLGCSQAALSFIERGARPPGLAVARKVEEITAGSEFAVRMVDWPPPTPKPLPAAHDTIRTTTDPVLHADKPAA